MSDVEEPPTKVTKIEELALSTEQNVSMESVGEGQEEWLSESVMTDDDYNTSQDTSILETTQDVSQEVPQETTHFGDETNANKTQENPELSVEITQATESVEAETSDQLSPTFTQDMGNIVHDDEQNNDANNPEPHQEENTTQIDNPENSIQNQTSPQHVTEQMETEQTEESLMNTVEATLDKMEHEEVPKGSEIKSQQDLLDDLDTFLIRKTPNERRNEEKREVEDDGHNTDELLEMLGEDDQRPKRKTGLKTLPKKATLATAESSDDDTFQEGEIKTLKLAKNAIIQKRGHTKADYVDSDMSSDEATSSVFRPSKHVLTKTAANSLLKTQFDKKPAAKLSTSTPLRTYSRSRMPRPGLEPRSLLKSSHEQESNEEQEAKNVPQKQQIMKPEEMDEEAAFDSDHSDESFYDDLPSSDSEEVEEWFALDVRAELAGDYIPLLGYKAYEILSEEKKRVSKKLAQLREGLSQLNESARRNMQEIEITRRKLDDLEGELSLA